MIKMYKITFTRHIRRQGSDGNLYITIPIAEERKNKIEEGELVDVILKKVKIRSPSNVEAIPGEST